MLLEYITGWNKKLSTSCVPHRMAMMITEKIKKLTSSPKLVMQMYFRVNDNIVPRTIPNIGPKYGIIFKRAVIKAIPIDALNPILAISNKPKKFRRATPRTSITIPKKYLDSRV